MTLDQAYYILSYGAGYWPPTGDTGPVVCMLGYWAIPSLCLATFLAGISFYGISYALGWVIDSVKRRINEYTN